jgi:GT2 family glycosyltransferase
VPDDTYYVSTAFDRFFVNHGIFLRAALADVGYFDEERYRFYHADTDLCLRLWQKGYEILDSPESYIEHFAHSTMKIRRSNDEGESESLRNFLAAWEGTYYDPNEPKIGGKIERHFVDPAATLARYFNRLPIRFRLAYAFEQAAARWPRLRSLARLTMGSEA